MKLVGFERKLAPMFELITSCALLCGISTEEVTDKEIGF